MAVTKFLRILELHAMPVQGISRREPSAISSQDVKRPLVCRNLKIRAELKMPTITDRFRTRKFHPNQSKSAIIYEVQPRLQIDSAPFQRSTPMPSPASRPQTPFEPPTLMTSSVSRHEFGNEKRVTRILHRQQWKVFYKLRTQVVN